MDTKKVNQPNLEMIFFASNKGGGQTLTKHEMNFFSVWSEISRGPDEQGDMLRKNGLK